MATVVKALHCYLGKTRIFAQPGQILDLKDDGELGRFFHDNLLMMQRRQPRPDAAPRFNAKVNIAEFPPVEAKFCLIGQTAGLAIWVRERGIPGNNVCAASVMLNGLELDNEFDQVRIALSQVDRGLPPDIAQELQRHERPILANFYYDLSSQCDPVIVTASNLLANSFFKMFGTNEVGC